MYATRWSRELHAPDSLTHCVCSVHFLLFDFIVFNSMAVLQICAAVWIYVFWHTVLLATEPIHRTYSRELKSRRRKKYIKRKRSSRSFIFRCEWKDVKRQNEHQNYPGIGVVLRLILCFKTEYIRTHESTAIVNRNRNVTRHTTYTVSEATDKSWQIKINRKKRKQMIQRLESGAKPNRKWKNFSLISSNSQCKFPIELGHFSVLERNKVLTIVAWKTHASLSRLFMFVNFLLFTFHRFIVNANCDFFCMNNELERNIHNWMENGRKRGEMEMEKWRN